MEELKFQKLTYLVTYPEGFSKTEKHPVLIYLHGAGSRGETTAVLRNNPFFKLTNNLEGQPFVCFAPLCSENTWFDLFEHLEAFVKEIAKLPYVDEKRIYLTGVSMGGYGTWQLAMSMPEYFAAIAPICGGGMYWNTERLKNLPVWAFHGGKDVVVFPEESQKMVDAINKKGGNAKLTIYPQTGHDAWVPAYSNPELFEWFLEHESNCKIEHKDEYTDAEIYG